VDIAQRRLYTQQISRPRATTPEAVVGWLGAVQAQDYPAARWAVGQRAAGATDAAVAAAYDAGRILRTHIMRPTWHFVTPADIRWLLALTAPRVHAQAATWYRRLELDGALLRQSGAVLTAALQGGTHLTRAELVAALAQAGIMTTEQLRFGYLMIWAELEGIICSGAMRGKQFTYALLEERAPPAPARSREEALAELTRRYFTSHGPATVADFVWWSGLTTADARAGLALLGAQLAQEEIGGQMYWYAPSAPVAPDPAPTAYLLPNYDEYIVAYKDRRAIMDAAQAARLDPRGNVLFSHTIVLDGQVAGIWKRTLTNDTVLLDTAALAPLTAAAQDAITAAADRYGRFLGLPVTLRR
jgi:hypothetical protein